ncbi:MAG: hypothetical protein KDN18_25285, partial [Verrucomicrobiae bacterium]|nr:hypothetical protein [Verrucomicrobiae bacterium]
MTCPFLSASLTFANESWAWVALLFGLGAILVLALTYRNSSLRGGAKFAAMSLKGLGLVLLALALMEPVHLDEVPKKHANDVALLADNSAGLAIPLGAEKEAPSAEMRSALVGAAPDQPPGWIAGIAETFRVQPFLVDRGLRQTGDFTGLDFTRNSSTLGAALENISTRFRGRPLAATVLLTDGNATDGAGLEALLAKEEALPPEKRVPVFPVIVGELDPSARDLAIARADATTTQFEDAQVTLDVEAVALGEIPGPVEVFVLNEKGEELARKELVFPSGSERRSVPVRLRLAGIPPGVSFLTAGIRQTADSPFDQLTEKNDRVRVAVNRGRGPYRILYLSGRPNWEYKFLRRSVAGDAELDLVGLIRIAKREPKFEWRGRSGESSNPLFRGFNRDIPEETQRYDQPVLVRLNTATPEELRDGFPKSAEELFTRYRSIIIDDLEADFFTAEQHELIEQFVSIRGGTVVMLGGQESFQEGGWDNTPTGRLLPVYLDQKEPGGPALDATYNLTREGWLEDWMRLRAGQDEEEIRLAYMPPFFAINRLPTIKPGASILSTVTDSEGRVLPALVTQRYGEGRAGALAVADFWRWGMKDTEQQAELAKMWRQFLRWTVTDVPARVELTKEESNDGAIPVTRLSVRVRDLKYDPQDDATVLVTVKDLDGTSRNLTAEPSLEEPGLFTAEYLSEESEGYRIEAKVIDGNGEEIGAGEAARSLNPEAAEFAHLGPDPSVLERLAKVTG